MGSMKRYLGFVMFVVFLFGSEWAQQQLPTRHLPEDVWNRVVPPGGRGVTSCSGNHQYDSRR
jgi:hypothetical protein